MTCNSQSIHIGHCDQCHEFTPQVLETLSWRCQVCCGNNNFSIERAFSVADPVWLAAFWHRKYFELKGGSFFQVVNGECIPIVGNIQQNVPVITPSPEQGQDNILKH